MLNLAIVSLFELWISDLKMWLLLQALAQLLTTDDIPCDEGFGHLSILSTGTSDVTKWREKVRSKFPALAHTL